MVVNVHGSRSGIYIGTIPNTPATTLLATLSTIASSASWSTDFVRSPRRRVPPNPPVPSSTMPLAAADRISGTLCAPLAPTCLGCAHRSPRSNDVVPRELAWHRRRCDSPTSRS
ncbi:hypothetical protein B0H13DRAFT_2324405 [Mycena leptocephala]|nr:hypothetical protein B0H13DRAFT_2324405 [Mycena leptocephala]